MKKFLIIVASLLFAFGSVSAETGIFAGGGTDFHVVNQVEGYSIDKELGWSFGIYQSLNEKFTLHTIYDYVVHKGIKEGQTEESIIFENKVLTTVSYLLNSTTDKFKISLLAGFEVTDGNIPDYGTFLSFANGVALSYPIQDKLNVWASANMSFAKDYAEGKLRFGFAYSLGDVF